MVDITGNMILFGINLFEVPVTMLILYLCIVAILFLFMLEIEFRQLRKIAKKMDEEDLTLTKELRELKDSVSELGDMLKKSFDVDVGPKKASEPRGNIQKG